MSKYRIVGNHMSWLICTWISTAKFIDGQTYLYIHADVEFGLLYSNCRKKSDLGRKVVCGCNFSTLYFTFNRQDICPHTVHIRKDGDDVIHESSCTFIGTESVIV